MDAVMVAFVLCATFISGWVGHTIYLNRADDKAIRGSRPVVPDHECIAADRKAMEENAAKRQADYTVKTQEIAKMQRIWREHESSRTDDSKK